MSLETDIQANTAAIVALTQAIMGQKPAEAAPAKPAPVKNTSKPASAPVVTREQVTNACVAVKGARGAEVAKDLIKRFGKADALKDVQPADFAALVAACEAALAEPVTAEEAVPDEL